MDWSLVQSSPTGSVYLTVCDIGTPKIKRPRLELLCRSTRRIVKSLLVAKQQNITIYGTLELQIHVVLASAQTRSFFSGSNTQYRFDRKWDEPRANSGTVENKMSLSVPRTNPVSPNSNLC
jgi:hypothetical protein